MKNLIFIIMQQNIVQILEIIFGIFRNGWEYNFKIQYNPEKINSRSFRKKNLFHHY